MVLVKRHIPDPMVCFDRPMVSNERGKRCRVSFLCGKTRDRENHFVPQRIASKVRRGPLNARYLLVMRKIDETDEVAARPQFPILYPSMSLIRRLVMRGGCPPTGGLRYRSSGSLDCL
jgi:hypothetical protein